MPKTRQSQADKCTELQLHVQYLEQDRRKTRTLYRFNTIPH